MDKDKPAHIKFLNIQKQEIETEKRNLENFLENLKKEFERDKIKMEKKLSEIKNISDNLEKIELEFNRKSKIDTHDDCDIIMYMRVLGHSEILERRNNKSDDSLKYHNFEYAKQWLESQCLDY